MNSRQEAKLNMYRAVLKQSEQNTQLVESVPAFAAAMAAFKTNTSAMLNTVQQQIQVTKGVAANKTAAKQLLCNFANDVAAAIFAYAAEVNDLLLEERSKTTLTDLLRAKDEELAPRCRNYYDLAKTNAGALKDYGITDTLTDAFKMAIDNYANEVPAPRNAVSQRAAYRKNLGKLVKTADLMLKKRLDKLVNSFKTTNPSYIDAYRSNRLILDPATTVTQLKVAIMSATGDLVKDAQMEIAEQNLVLKSNTKGSVLVKPIIPGIYTLNITAPGFEMQTIPEVKAALGQVNNLSVKLKPKS